MRFYKYFFNVKTFAENIATQNAQRKEDGKKPYRIVKKIPCKDGTKYEFAHAGKKYNVYCPRETDKPQQGAMFTFYGDEASPEFFKSLEFRELQEFIDTAYAGACREK